MNIGTIRRQRFILAAMAVALALRVAWGIYLDPHQLYFPDSQQWNRIALNFLSGNGLILDEGAKALRPPVYSLFLSFIYFVFGKENLLAVRIIQALVSSCTCLIVYLLGKRLFSATTAKIAMAACAIYPFFVYYSGAILTETLFIFILSLIMLSLSAKRFAWAGIFFGLGILCRTELVVFFFFALAGMFIILRKREALRRAIVMTAITGAILFPWTLRNYRVFHEFVPLTTMSGYTFYEGNGPRNPTGGPVDPRTCAGHAGNERNRKGPLPEAGGDTGDTGESPQNDRTPLEQIQTPLEYQAEYGQPGVCFEADRSGKHDQLRAVIDPLHTRPCRFMEAAAGIDLRIFSDSPYDGDQSGLRIFAAIPSTARAFHDYCRKLRIGLRRGSNRGAKEVEKS